MGVEQELTESQHYGICTKYFRTVYNFNLIHSFPKPNLFRVLCEKPIDSAASPLQMCFPKEQIHAIGTGGAVKLYTWATQLEFEFLRSEDGASFLDTWLLGVDIDPAEVEEHTENICGRAGRAVKIMTRPEASWEIANAGVVETDET